MGACISLRHDCVCRGCVAYEFYAFYTSGALIRSVSYGNTEGWKVQVPPPASIQKHLPRSVPDASLGYRGVVARLSPAPIRLSPGAAASLMTTGADGSGLRLCCGRIRQLCQGREGFADVFARGIGILHCKSQTPKMNTWTNPL
jgi:hypothetical protein